MFRLPCTEAAQITSDGVQSSLDAILNVCGGGHIVGQAERIPNLTGEGPACMCMAAVEKGLWIQQHV